MRYGIPSRACIVAAAALFAACDRNNAAQDIEKERREATEEIARIQREADQKVTEARREADKKIAEAQKEAQKDIAKEQTRATKDIAEERRELEASLRSAKRDTLQEYREYAKDRMRLLELREGELRATAAPAAASQADYNLLMKDLDTKKKMVQGTMNELDKASADQWPALKGRVETALDDLEKTLETIDKKY